MIACKSGTAAVIKSVNVHADKRVCRDQRSVSLFRVFRVVNFDSKGVGL